jgi:hypothetical protein
MRGVATGLRTWRATHRMLAAAACVVTLACVRQASWRSASIHCVADALYFGRDIPGAGRPDSAYVSAAAWRAFADEALPHWFPDGSTETDANGRFISAGVTVAESTKVVTIIHPVNARAAASIDSVVAIYRRRFNQQSVGRVRWRVRSSFCE